MEKQSSSVAGAEGSWVLKKREKKKCLGNFCKILKLRKSVDNDYQWTTFLVSS